MTWRIITMSWPGELKPGQFVELDASKKPGTLRRLLLTLVGSPWKPTIGVVHEVNGCEAKVWIGP